MKKVLSVGAHPDDIEIGCGGTELSLIEKGYSITHLIITDGEEGGFGDSKANLSKIRRHEAQESGKCIGVNETLFFGAPDGLTTFTKKMKVKLVGIIRKIRPDIIFTHSSTDHFPDHLVTHQLTVSAIEAAKGPWYHDSGGHPHAVEQVFGYEVWHPMNNFQISQDISSTIERKLLALGHHTSQLKEINYISAVKGLAEYRGVMTMAGNHAEVFEVIKSGGIK